MVSFSLIGIHRHCNHTHNCNCDKKIAEIKEDIRKNDFETYKKFQSCIDRINSLDNAIGRFSSDNRSEINSKLNEYRRKIDNINSDIDRLRIDANLHGVLISRMKSDLDNFVNIIDNIQNAIRQNREDIQNLRIEVNRNSGDINTINRNMSAMNSRIDKHEQEIHEQSRINRQLFSEQARVNSRMNKQDEILKTQAIRQKLIVQFALDKEFNMNSRKFKKT